MDEDAGSTASSRATAGPWMPPCRMEAISDPWEIIVVVVVVSSSRSSSDEQVGSRK